MVHGVWTSRIEWDPSQGLSGRGVRLEGRLWVDDVMKGTAERTLSNPFSFTRSALEEGLCTSAMTALAAVRNQHTKVCAALLLLSSYDTCTRPSYNE
jgi:hypothetical protein